MLLSERFQLSKIEGQVWISLYELLLNPQCLSKYDYTDYKKNQILKVKLDKILNFKIKIFSFIFHPIEID